MSIRSSENACVARFTIKFEFLRTIFEDADAFHQSNAIKPGLCSKLIP